jgi:hypothetical protein
LARIVAIAFLVVTASCGGYSGNSPITGRTATGQLGDELHTNWRNPIDGIRVDSLAAADESMEARIYEPRGLGPPTDIFVGRFNNQVVAFLYETEAYGLVVVREAPIDDSREVYEASQEAVLKYNGKPYTSGHSEIHTIRNGHQALLTVSEDGKLATIFWLQGTMEISVDGPAIGPAEAVNLAETM